MDGNNKLNNSPKIPTTRYFQSVEELLGDPSVEADRQIEFGVPAPGDGSELHRRDFIKLVGTTFAAASVTTGCARRPVEKVIPYVNKPEEITPGVASWYATVCGGCDTGCGLLMKARDGRPIKVEGNPEHPLNQGGVCARGQGGVLDLYDGDRLRAPQVGGKDGKWDAWLADAGKQLSKFEADGKGLALVTRPVSGPGGKAVIAAFQGKYPGARHVTFEAINYSAIADAHAATHGRKAVPTYDFSKADVVVSFGADFLGSWLSPVQFAAQWAAGRKINASKKDMSTHVQVETRLSITGASADKRIRVLPSAQRDLVMALASKVAGGTATIPAASPKQSVDGLAKLLSDAKGKSLVVSDSDDVAVQAAVNAINEALGNYGKTVDINAPFGGAQADNAATDKLLADLGGAISGVIFADVNPVYASSKGAAWKAAIGKAGVSIALNQRKDETAAACKTIGAASHFLESWADSEHIPGVVSIQQPLIRPLYASKPWQEVVLALVGEKRALRTFIADVWKDKVHPRAEGAGGFQAFWDKAVHDGFTKVAAGEFAEVEVQTANPEHDGWARKNDAITAQKTQLETLTGRKNRKARAELEAAIAAATAALGAEPAKTTTRKEKKIVTPEPAAFSKATADKALATAAGKATGGKYELVLYEKTGVGAEGSNNPMLHELPGSMTRVAWDNYALISPKTGQALGVLSGDRVTVKAGGVSMDLPVVLGPGLHDGAIAVALGYGRSSVGKIGNGVGANAWPAAASTHCDVTKTGAKEKLGFIQQHHSAEHRDIVREATLQQWQKDPRANNPELPKALRRDKKQDGEAVAATPIEGKSVWGDSHKYNTYKWHMVIDQNACIGCGACVVSCNIENNVPVVGKKECATHRDMHWMRIDRYYAERPENQPKPGKYDWDPTEPDLLAIAENPDVIFQPVMCQHCENAPCENVCPVLATVHTSEGLNAMAYNRCIGTRYCANNCPYKVRRFNWFNYPEDTDMDGKQDPDMVRLALNPDIVKRSRGVMEKCTMCVQRIQQGKSDAIRMGKDKVPDGLVQTACSQSCPTQAITFGNVVEENSAVRKAWDDPRRYRLVEEIGTRPSIGYLVKVRNRPDGNGGAPAAPAEKAAKPAEKKEG